MSEEIFNPLDKRNLAKSIATAIFSQPAIPLSELKSFYGAGVYALYYKGDFPLYEQIKKSQRERILSTHLCGESSSGGCKKRWNGT